ncbi:MAG: methyl-accepting chemotaxis protein [candidate division WOR-3 bacterium]
MSVNEELHLKGLNFIRKGSGAIILFSLLFEIVFLLGAILKFFIVPTIVVILTTTIFIFGLVVYFLARKNIYHPVMPYIITATVVLVLTFCLSYIPPQFRLPFFLIYFYVAVHPGYLLGMKNGIYAILMVDVAYALMVLQTQNIYPEVNLGMEFVKLILFTIVSFLLIMDFDYDQMRLQHLKEALKKVEKGDLTVTITEGKSTDEIYFLSRTINKLLETEASIIKLIIETSKNLSEISAQIAATSNELSTAISEIVSTTQRMTEGVDRQYQELDKSISMSKALSEISFSVVDNIKKVEGYAESFSTSASNGLKMSDEVLKNIELIGSRYEYLIGLLARLHEVSATITKIIETINSVSEKINILSLNAAIEAARAGEFGRGFAIVADEIKKLADNTQNSAMEIGVIVKEMIESIQSVAASSEEVRKAISDGNQIIKATTESLRTISNAVIELNSAIKNIKTVISKEEEEITAMLRQIEDSFNISKENSTAAEEILASLEEQSAATEQFAATSQELLNITERLAQVIKNFKI